MNYSIKMYEIFEVLSWAIASIYLRYINKSHNHAWFAEVRPLEKLGKQDYGESKGPRFMDLAILRLGVLHRGEV